jgi:hypothetical protein
MLAQLEAKLLMRNVGARVSGCVVSGFVAPGFRVPRTGVSGFAVRVQDSGADGEFPRLSIVSDLWECVSAASAPKPWAPQTPWLKP